MGPGDTQVVGLKTTGRASVLGLNPCRNTPSRPWNSGITTSSLHPYSSPAVPGPVEDLSDPLGFRCPSRSAEQSGRDVSRGSKISSFRDGNPGQFFLT